MTRPLAAALVAVSAATAAAQPCPPSLAVGALGGGYPASSSGQPTAQDIASGHTAVPPDQAALDRLRLATEWTSYLPLEGRRDGIAMVQVVDESQIYVQTRAGLLVAVDARTGGIQWTQRYATGYVDVHQVAVTDRLVVAASIDRLYAFQRADGFIVLDQPLTGYVSTGPTVSVGKAYVSRGNRPPELVNQTSVYLVLSNSKVVAFRLPTGDFAAVPTRLAPPPPVPASMWDRPQTLEPTAVSSYNAVHRTASINSLIKVSPPYSMYDRRLQNTPSLATIPNMAYPYTLYPEGRRTLQRTPSITAFQTLGRARELLTPRYAAPLPIAWTYRPTFRLIGRPLVTPGAPDQPPRIWATSDGRHVVALSAINGKEQVSVNLEDTIVAPVAGPAVVDSTPLAFLNLASGITLAIDPSRGGPDGYVTEWRTNVGGRPNRQPVPTTDAVFVAGDNAGLAKLDLRTGDVRWRTTATADRLLAVTAEYVYVMDRSGTLLVYPNPVAGVTPDRMIDPVGRLDVGDFTVPVTNNRTDRVLLAADNGLLVSLRDADPRYALPARVSPPAAMPTKKSDAPPPAPAPADPAPPPAPEPKKEAPKKGG